jgi:DNA invertase Pin-like site-specific DNA recombinase
MSFDAYIRVSRKGQREGDSYITVDEQRRVIAETANRKGVELSGVEVVEEDVSGSTKATKRRLEELLERAETGQSEGLIVAFQDRLSRGSLKDQAEIWDRLEKARARLVTGDGLDSADAGQELLFAVKAAIARDQWKRHQRNWQAARESAVRRGLHIASHVPTGYVHTKGQPLAVDPNLAPVVVGLFERRAKRWNFSRLAKWLSEQPHTNGIANRETVRCMIANRAYLGIAYSDEYEKRNAHPAIISQKLWDEANAVAGIKTRGDGSLSGQMLALALATCDNCGHRLQAIASRRKNPETGKVERSAAYTCKNINCDSRAFVFARELDSFVTVNLTMMGVAVGESHLHTPGSSDVAEASKRLEEAEYDKRAFVKNRELRRLLSEEEYNTELESLIEAVTEAQIALTMAKSDETAAATVPVAELWSSWNMETKREYAHKVIATLSVKSANRQRGVPLAERVVIEWAGAVPKITPFANAPSH